MLTVNAYAAPSATEPLVPTTIERRDVGPKDVLIEIRYAGICHSDIHTVRGDWGPITYPQVVGHEIVGVVAEVGSEVTQHEVGDRVGVGCMVNSCRECENCLAGKEQYCLKGNIGTYAAVDLDGTITQGGYSTHVVVDEDFVLRVPEAIPLDAAAPLLCAGITTYSPLAPLERRARARRSPSSAWAASGHMAVKIAHAMGAEVTVLSQSLSKQDDGLQLGADHYYATSDPATFKQLANTFDLIINTVSAAARPRRVPGLLRPRRHPGERRRSGRAAAGARVHSVRQPSLLRRLGHRQHPRDPGDARLLRRARHRPRDRADRADDINEAYERVLRSDVRYRFVIDIDTLR